MLLGLPALVSADLLLTLVNLLTPLGSLGLVVSPRNLGTVGVEKLEIRSKLSRRRLVPGSGATALVYELKGLEEISDHSAGEGPGGFTYRLEAVDEECGSDGLVSLVPLLVLRMIGEETLELSSRRPQTTKELTSSGSEMKTAYSLVLAERGLKQTALDSLPIVE